MTVALRYEKRTGVDRLFLITPNARIPRVEWFLRLSRPVRLALVAAILVVALFALFKIATGFRGDPVVLESSTEVPASPAADPQGGASSDVAGGLVGLATLPLSILTRAQWASTGHYRFPVIDGRDGPAVWSGTISLVETAISGYSGTGSFNRGATSMQETETSKIAVQLTETLDEQSVGTAYVSVKGRAEASYNWQKTHASWTLESCGSVKNRKMNNTSRESSNGSGTGDAAVAVSIYEDGTDKIMANVTSIRFPIDGRFAGELEVFRQACAVELKASARPHAPTDRSLGGPIQAVGRVDPANPDLLSGSISEEIPQEGLSPGRPTSASRRPPGSCAATRTSPADAPAGTIVSGAPRAESAPSAPSTGTC